MRYLVRHAQPIGIRNYLQIRSDVGQVGIYIRSVSSQSQITIKLNASIENRARLVYAAVQIKSATRTRSQVSHCASKVAYLSCSVAVDGSKRKETAQNSALSAHI